MQLYAKYGKRGLDFFLSLSAILILSPLLVLLTAIGAAASIRTGRTANIIGTPPRHA